MSTNTALDQIKNRVEGHTEGPWEADHTDPGVWSQEHIVVGQYTANDGFDSQMWEDGTKADRELLAAAPKLLAALEAVEALHYADAEVDGLYPQACSEGPCEHEDDCPEVTITPCYECSTPGWDYVAWPCPTIKAITEALR